MSRDEVREPAVRTGGFARRYGGRVERPPTGKMIKTTGDGAPALFTGPTQGVRCAQQVVADADGFGLRVRAGLHTGEVERSRDDIAGLGVHLAARIMGLADAGEVFVSRTVRDLVIGSELTFSDRGEHELKGIPDRWGIYAAA